MASLFGSVAQEVGGAVKENSANTREERLKDEEYAREQQLEKQRMAFESSNLDRRLKSDDDRAGRMIEADRILQVDQQTFETGYREADRTASATSDDLKAQTDILTTAMRVYASQSESSIVRGNDWTTKIEKSFDMQTGQPTETLYATHNGRTYQQQGDKMFDAGEKVNPAKFNTIDQQRAAEAKLYNGDVTAEQFKDVFSYIPAGYVFGEVSKGSDFGSFLKKNNIRVPAFGIGAGDRRDTSRNSDDGGAVDPNKVDKMRREQGANGNYAPRPSVEELSKGPERDANIAEKGGTNDELTSAYRASGAPGGSFADGSYLLSQGQATEEAPLDQGGQLMGPEAPSAQVAAPGGGELDDAGAAEISQAVRQSWVNAEGRVDIPGVKKLGESFIKLDRSEGITAGSNQ